MNPNVLGTDLFWLWIGRIAVACGALSVVGLLAGMACGYVIEKIGGMPVLFRIVQEAKKQGRRPIYWGANKKDIP